MTPRPATSTHRDQAEQPGTADHAHRDPVAEIAQRLDAGVGALEFDREDLFVAHQQHAEQPAPATAPRAAR